MNHSAMKAKIAPDALKSEQKWTEKLMSVAGRLNTKYISPWFDNNKNSTSNDHQESSPTAVLYPHVFKLHLGADRTWVFIASSEVFSVWACHDISNTTSYDTELVVAGTDLRIIDGCLMSMDSNTNAYTCYVATDTSDSGSHSFLVKKREGLLGRNLDCEVASAQFSGEIVSMTAVNKYVVLCQVGMLKLLCRDSLHVFVDIPSVPGIPVVCTASDRWFALQSTCCECLYVIIFFYILK